MRSGRGCGIGVVRSFKFAAGTGRVAARAGYPHRLLRGPDASSIGRRAFGPPAVGSQRPELLAVEDERQAEGARPVGVLALQPAGSPAPQNRSTNRNWSRRACRPDCRRMPGPGSCRRSFPRARMRNSSRIACRRPNRIAACPDPGWDWSTWAGLRTHRRREQRRPDRSP